MFLLLEEDINFLKTLKKNLLNKEFDLNILNKLQFLTLF